MKLNSLLALFPYLWGQLLLKDLPGPELISHPCSECLDRLRAAAALCRESRNSILPRGYRDYLLVSVASAWCRHKHTLHNFFSFKKKKKERKKEKALQQRILSRVQRSWQLMVQYYHMTWHHKHETRSLPWTVLLCFPRQQCGSYVLAHWLAVRCANWSCPIFTTTVTACCCCFTAEFPNASSPRKSYNTVQAFSGSPLT